MYQGKLLAIYITPAAGQPLQLVEQAHAVPGKGLEGDRYFLETGSYSDHPGPDREITLIEIEALQALKDESELDLSQAEARRNLVTQGVPLNHLVGKEFQVGDVRLRGVRLCEPCSYLARLTQAEVLSALIHRGGLRAAVVNEGILRQGDAIIA
jgi:MOSC domain-containing protein YiiM